MRNDRFRCSAATAQLNGRDMYRPSTTSPGCLQHKSIRPTQVFGPRGNYFLPVFIVNLIQQPLRVQFSKRKLAFRACMCGLSTKGRRADLQCRALQQWPAYGTSTHEG